MSAFIYDVGADVPGKHTFMHCMQVGTLRI
jgi:hypothetical protein